MREREMEVVREIGKREVFVEREKEEWATKDKKKRKRKKRVVMVESCRGEHLETFLCFLIFYNYKTVTVKPQ